MAFFEDNYWGQPKSDPEAIKAQLAAALAARKVPANNMGYVGPMFSIAQRQAAGDIPDFDSSSGNFTNPRISGSVPKASPTNPRPAREYSASALDKDITERSAIKTVTDIAKSILGIGGDAVSAYENSPEGVLSRLRDQYPQYQYSGRSAEEMAQSEFSPQFQILKEVAAANQARYGTNKNELSGLWNALSADVVKQRGQNQQVYNTANQEIGGIYDTAAQSTTQGMNSATKQMGDVLALLGQNEAAPELLQNKQELLASSLDRTNAGRATAQELNRNLGANAYAYDTSRIGTTQQAGLGAQQDLLQQFLDMQNENDMRRLDVQGQQGAAQNKYELMIQELMQNGTTSREGAINDAFQQLMTSRNQDEQNALGRDKLSLDAKRLELDQQNSLQRNAGQANPYQSLLDTTSGYYQNDPATGRVIADRIEEVGRENPNASMQDFWQFLEEEFPGFFEQPYAKELAYQYYYQLLKDRQR